MATEPTDFLRFRTNPKQYIPPDGHADFCWSRTLGTFVSRNAAGAETPVGGADAASVLTAVAGMTPAQITQLLSDLAPNRILYTGDKAASWFNGTHTELVGVVPLTAAQAVVGTKVRVRGTIKLGFQGTAPASGDGSNIVAVVFNVASDAANQFEGVVLTLSESASNYFLVDMELELKAGTSGKYKLGLGSNTASYSTLVVRNAITPSRGAVTVVDPTVQELLGSTAGLVVQLQNFGNTNYSIANVWMDINCEVITT